MLVVTLVTAATAWAAADSDANVHVRKDCPALHKTPEVVHGHKPYKAFWNELVAKMQRVRCAASASAANRRRRRR